MRDWVKVTRIDGKSFLLDSLNISHVEDGDANSCTVWFEREIPGNQQWESPMRGMTVQHNIDAMQDILNGEFPVSTGEMMDRR